MDCIVNSVSRASFPGTGDQLPAECYGCSCSPDFGLLRIILLQHLRLIKSLEFQLNEKKCHSAGYGQEGNCSSESACSASLSFPSIWEGT